jgi:hypothetical protein
MFTVLAKLLYATSHNERVIAELVPSLWETPTWSEVQEDEEGCFWVDGDIPVLFPADPGQEDRILNSSIPVEPAEAFGWMQSQWGDVVAIATGGVDEGSILLVSPTLAKKLGTGEGGQLHLYAEVVYQLVQLLQSPTPADEDIFRTEWKQWCSSHSSAILDVMVGGEIAREQAKAGLLAKASRGKGVYSAKVGAWLFNVEDVEGNRHPTIPGELYVSSASPLAKLDGMTSIPWRNPMPFLDALTVKAVGPATKVCKKPSIETKEPILPEEKIFAHPFQISKTAGDVDGDGWQFLVLEKILGWACKPKNKAAIDAIPGLWEGLLEYFLEDDGKGKG